MYSKKSGLIFGFHGCDATLVQDVVAAKKRLQPSVNPYDWLGHGVYFWEHNLRRAWLFAEEKCKRKLRVSRKKVSPGVLGATIELGRCLDLMDSEHIEYLKRFHEFLQLLKIKLPENSLLDSHNVFLKRELDCTVLEFLHHWRYQNGLPAFDSVRCAFQEGAALYPTSGFHEKNHIQICIRNPACIKAYFIPLEEAVSESLLQ